MIVDVLKRSYSFSEKGLVEAINLKSVEKDCMELFTQLRKVISGGIFAADNDDNCHGYKMGRN